MEQVTTRHILSPIPCEGGRRPLCGAPYHEPSFDGLDEAYRACVEGVAPSDLTCRNCVAVAIIAMGCPTDRLTPPAQGSRGGGSDATSSQ